MESKGEHKEIDAKPNKARILTNAMRGLVSLHGQQMEADLLFSEEPRSIEQTLSIYAQAFQQFKTNLSLNFVHHVVMEGLGNPVNVTLLRIRQDYSADIADLELLLDRGPWYVALHQAGNRAEGFDSILLSIESPGQWHARRQNYNQDNIMDELVRLLEIHLDMFWTRDPETLNRFRNKPATHLYAVYNTKLGDVDYLETEIQRVSEFASGNPAKLPPEERKQWDEAASEQAKAHILNKFKTAWERRLEVLTVLCADSDEFYRDLKTTIAGLEDCKNALKWGSSHPMRSFLDAARKKPADILCDTFAQKVFRNEAARCVSALFVFLLARRHEQKGWKQRIFLVLDPYTMAPDFKSDKLAPYLYAPNDMQFVHYRSYAPALFAAHREVLVQQAMSAFAMTVSGYKDRVANSDKSKEQKSDSKEAPQEPFPQMPARLVPIIMSFLKGRFNATAKRSIAR